MVILLEQLLKFSRFTHPAKLVEILSKVRFDPKTEKGPGKFSLYLSHKWK